MPAVTYYPGCSLKTSSRFYEASLLRVLGAYDVSLQEMEDWSCCGATAAVTVDDEVADLLTARNLAAAEKMGRVVVAPCSACYSRLKTVNDRLRRDNPFRRWLNGLLSPLSCDGTVEVRNVIELFGDYVGMERIAASRAFDCAPLRVVAYYGCVLTRIPGHRPFDDPEDPSSMDRLLWALGFGVADWDFKMECCGAGKTVTSPEITRSLSQAVVDRAIGWGADAVVTSCPLCQMNLDLLPALGGTASPMPVIFLSEAFELALYGRLSGEASHMVPVGALREKIKRR